MRGQNLSAVKAGITRLRDKGGASPDALYDLLNGYVTAARTIRIRPGTRIEVTLPPGTKGLAWFDGKFVVFATEVTDPGDDRVEVEVIRHPESPELPLVDIHFAMPFLGYLYVVAEFAGGDVFHYWLEKGEVWQPGKVYLPGTLVRPTDGNGMAYRLQSAHGDYVPWAPNVERAVGDVVVPTTDNGYRYVVTDVSGADARSGSSEPAWPAEDGASVFEDANVADPFTTQPPTGAGSPTPVPPDVSDRYGRGVNRTSES